MNKIVILLLSLLLSACVTIAPVINPSSTIDIYGVQALPPQNGNWLVMLANGYQSTLASKGLNQNESLVVNVSIFQLPELDSETKLLAHIVSLRGSEPDTGRFVKQESSDILSSLNDATCVKYQSISVDKNAVIAGGKATMLLESIGYNCQHPLRRTVGVNIEYSSRHFEDTPNLTIINDSESFFKTVSFTEF